MSRLFGWDYPPGVSKLPWDEPTACDICGKDTDDCICPECPQCGSFGDPICYAQHGLIRSQAQTDSLATESARWAEDAKRYEPPEE